MSSNPLRLRFLLRRYLDNQCTAGELEELWQLMSTLSDDDLILSDISELWHQTDATASEDSGYWDMVTQRLSQKVEETRNAPVHSIHKRRKNIFRFAAAASILASVLLAAWFFTQKGNDNVVSQKVKPASGHQVITLSDGTRVTLNSESKLDYPAAFHGSNRSVYLTGEAYFDVAHDANKPFLVHTGTYVIKVLGTSFNVKAYPGEDDMEVTVTKGKVQVQNSAANKTMGILIPGEKLLINKHTSTSGIIKADLSKTLEWKSQALIFDNITFDEAAVTISNRYSTDIIFANDKLRDCRFTGKFSDDMNLEEVLDIICVLTKANWKRNGSNIEISGAGCKQ